VRGEAYIFQDERGPDTIGFVPHCCQLCAFLHKLRKTDAHSTIVSSTHYPCRTEDSDVGDAFVGSAHCFRQ